MQEVFLHLLEKDCRTLRTWDPARGRSLPSFITLVAQRQVYSAFRGRGGSWLEQPVDGDRLDGDVGAAGPADPEQMVVTRRFLETLVEAVRARSGERGVQHLLLLMDGRPVSEICEITQMKENSVHQIHSRLRALTSNLLREFNGDAAGNQ